MKVIVRKFLNVRVGKPSVNAPCYQYLAPGSELEVDGTLTKGDVYDGVDTWFRDLSNNYYWSGGVENAMKALQTNAIVNYNQLVNLPAAVTATRGKGIKVGIIDTGCYNHPSLAGKILAGQNFVDNTSDCTDVSDESHGTFISGIIAAGGAASEVTGLAPDCGLIIAKASDDGSINGNTVIKALTWMIAQKPDIINFSFDFAPLALKPALDALFTSAASQGIILVGAGQDNAGVFKNNIYYPGNNSDFISIGSVSSATLLNYNLNNVKPGISFLMQELQFKSTNRLGTYDVSIGSSFAAAFLSGSIALALAYLKATGGSNPVAFLNASVSQLLNGNQFQNQFILFKK